MATSKLLVAALAALASGQSARMVTVHRATRTPQLRVDRAGEEAFSGGGRPEGGFSCGVHWRGGCGVLWRSEFGDGWAGRSQDDPAISD